MTDITITQMLAVNEAMRQEWFRDTGTAFNEDEFWGRALLAYSLGATGSGIADAAIVTAHCLGDRAVRQYDESSTLDECNRSARHYSKICRKALEK